MKAAEEYNNIKDKLDANEFIVEIQRQIEELTKEEDVARELRELRAKLMRHIMKTFNDYK